MRRRCWQPCATRRGIGWAILAYFLGGHSLLSVPSVRRAAWSCNSKSRKDAARRKASIVWCWAMAGKRVCPRRLRSFVTCLTTRSSDAFGSGRLSASPPSPGNPISAAEPLYPRARRTALGSARAQASMVCRGVSVTHLLWGKAQISDICSQYEVLRLCSRVAWPRPPTSEWTKTMWNASRRRQASAATAETDRSRCPRRTAGSVGVSTGRIPVSATSAAITRGMSTSKYSKSEDPSQKRA